MKEIWKDIKGFEGLYQISNLGNVKSLRHWRKQENFIMKQQPNSTGYLRVCLKLNRTEYHKFVHRLVAEAFIDNPNNFEVVNHLDCNPKNNIVTNLEWTTRKGNSEYMVKLGRNKRTKEWLSNLRSTNINLQGKPVVRINPKNKQIKWYECLNSVRQDGFTSSEVSHCCNHKRKKLYKGFVWMFATEYRKEDIEDLLGEIENGKH